MTPERTYEHYLALSRQAVAAHGPVDLVVWPETMFRFPLIEADADAAKPDWYPKSAAEFRAEAARWTALGRQAVAQLARELDAALLLGIDVQRFTAAGQQWRNSAVYVGRDGAICGRYDKMHLVIFGEYVPLAGWFPWLQKLTPLPFSIEAGGAPAVFSHQGLRFSPNICYENVLPQVIRRQVNAGIARGEGPDVLVNLTNDGWFWGSSELDMHLACGVFRAVECRKPLLIAANTGFSAWIDGDGRVRARGPRRQSATILATAAADGRTSWYLRHGDWFAATCLALTLAVGVAALVQRVRSGKGRTFGYAK
jgi:apolipoprotein N-acyltransferase